MDLARTWFVADRLCLGEPEHQHAVTLVGPDGSTEFMLADPDHHCDQCPLPSPPAHEQAGPLPRQVRGMAVPGHRQDHQGALHQP